MEDETEMRAACLRAVAWAKAKGISVEERAGLVRVIHGQPEDDAPLSARQAGAVMYALKHFQPFAFFALGAGVEPEGCYRLDEEQHLVAAPHFAMARLFLRLADAMAGDGLGSYGAREEGAMVKALKREMTIGYAERDAKIEALRADVSALYEVIGETLEPGAGNFPVVVSAATADVQEIGAQREEARAMVAVMTEKAKGERDCGLPIGYNCGYCKACLLREVEALRARLRETK